MEPAPIAGLPLKQTVQNTVSGASDGATVPGTGAGVGPVHPHELAASP